MKEIETKGHEPHSLEDLTSLIENPNYTGDEDGIKYYVLHYTCNAPKEETLLNEGVFPIGDKYGCADKREVVIMNDKKMKEILEIKKIPDDIDKSELVILCEQFLRKLTEKKEKEEAKSA